MIKKLTLNSNLGTHFYNAWLFSDMHNINEAYGKPSDRKRKVFTSIYREYINDDNAVDLKVIAKNTYHFTTAYAIKDDDEIVTLVVHTPYTKYIIDLRGEQI